MVQKIRFWLMSTDNKTMFNEYVKYFPTIEKRVKLLRGGKIQVSSDKEQEIFDSWESLNEKYQLFKTVTVPVQKERIPFKIWTYGDPNRYNDIREAMEKKYLEVCGHPIKMDSLDFKKKDWVYYIDQNINFCQSGNEMVINLLLNSSDWTEFKLPIKKFTKAEIAGYVGLNVDQFEIV